MIRNFVESQVRMSVFDIIEQITPDEIEIDTTLPDEDPDRPVMVKPIDTDVLNVVNAIFRAPLVKRLDTKEGWLLKADRNFFGQLKWERYYTRLMGKNMLFYSNEAEENLPEGSLNFDLMTVENFIINDDEINICPKGTESIVRLRVENEGDLKMWALTLYNNVKASLGSQMDLLVRNERYLTDYNINQNQFFSMVDTGDILLFRGKSSNAKTLRLVMGNSPYDHVGIFLKDLQKKIYLVEATGNFGVSAISFQHFVQNEWYKSYEKLVFRKLECEKDDEYYNKFINFANQVLGKKYVLNARKLLQRKSVAPTTQEEEGYFCSELVASFYKRCGLLPLDLSASQYWPPTFCQTSDLKLIDGFLGPEMLINFDEEQAKK